VTEFLGCGKLTANEREWTLMKIGWVGVFGENDSFPFQSWILEIDDESQWEFCDAQVVENLATLDISNAIDGFSFDDDFFVGD
jgi:hypothetical protein